MSAGPFTRSRYQASWNTARIYPIRVQPETIAIAQSGAPTVTNAPPTEDITEEPSAVVSKPKNGLGLGPRKFTLELVGTPPTGYTAGSQITVPILTETFYNDTPRNSIVTYLGTTWEVVSKTPESAR